jgi:hypothetical protein
VVVGRTNPAPFVPTDVAVVYGGRGGSSVGTNFYSTVSQSVRA